MKNKIKKIHFVGIKGVGVAPLAIIAKEAGFGVTGSDIDETFITDPSLEKAGIKPLVGFDPSHIEGSDLVITTGAHMGFDNPEVKEAKKIGIPVWTQGEAIGKIMQGELLNRNYEGISVSGSHGKTTTTAMIATILKENNFDPSFLIGTGDIPSLGSSGHFGKGKYFVAEADEYATEPKYDKTPKLLWQKPKIGVITNIELDHPDLYESVEDLKEVFLKFSEGIDKNDTLIASHDDKETLDLLKKYKGNRVTFGFSKEADLTIERLNIEEDKMFFWVNAKGTSLGEFILNVMGEHNAMNALCSLAVCLELGLSTEQIKKGLSSFKGSKRRLEPKGEIPSGALLYDDYAHHPTEIKKTLQAFKKIYPNKKIVCIFQPHTFSRTKILFEQFVTAFSSADIILLTDIYPSLREEPDSSVSSELLAQSIKRIHKDVVYTPTLEDVVKYLDSKRFGREFVVITMGAGDVYKISEKLLA
jgi:UDP-N-acetylmuramate--alanine ligase